MKKIPLSGERGAGLFMLVDDWRYDEMKQYVWNLYTNALGANYAYTRISGATVYAHSIVFGRKASKGHRLDHINGNTLDNQEHNIREITHGNNSANRGTTKGRLYLGVLYRRDFGANPYVARVVVNKKRVLYQRCGSEKEAAIARDEWYRQSDQADIVRYNFPLIGERGLDGKLRTK